MAVCGIVTFPVRDSGVIHVRLIVVRDDELGSICLPVACVIHYHHVEVGRREIRQGNGKNLSILAVCGRGGLANRHCQSRTESES